MKNSPDSAPDGSAQPNESTPNAPPLDMRQKIIGISNQSMRKSYYPALRKRVEQLERYRQLMDKAGEAVCLLRYPGFTFDDINLTTCEIFSASRDKITGKCIFDYIDANTAEEIRAWGNNCFHSEAQPTTVKFFRTDQNGNTNWYNCTLSATQINQDKFIVALIKNITEDFKLDEQTKRNSYFVQAMFDNSFQFIGLISLEGHLMAANQTALNVIGSDGRNVIGKIFWDTPWWASIVESRNDLIKAFKKSVKGELVRYETTNAGSSGKIIDVDLSLKPVFNESNEVTMVIAEGRDITEKKKLEEVVRHTQKIDSIGQLAGGIAHDFNNMLGGIMGAAEILKAKCATHSELNKLVDMIINTTNKASILTRRLLAFSRKDTPLNKVISLNETIREITVILERSINKKIGLVLKLKAGNDGMYGDTVQLQSAVINLGINARDAMPKGGNVTIQTENVHLDEQFCKNSMLVIKPGEYLRLSVKDQGSGIDADEIQKIFEPFYTTKESGKGTGLGLAAVYSTVQDHNGTISVISCPGSGTTFNLYFPLASAAGETSNALLEDTSTQPSPPQRRTALVIDDEDIIRTTTRYILESLGFSVLTAQNGQEGLSIYQSVSSKTDLIILDIVMPEMSGEEAFNKIRSINPKAKIIFSSGYTRQTSIQSLLTDKDTEFLQKPFRMQQLNECIKKLDL